MSIGECVVKSVKALSVVLASGMDGVTWNDRLTECCLPLTESSLYRVVVAY